MRGRVKISGAKNAVLPIIAATLLGQESPSILDEVAGLGGCLHHYRGAEAAGGQCQV